MLQFTNVKQRLDLGSYSTSDTIMTISGILLICLAVAFTIAAEESIPTAFRLVFFVLFAISMYKSDFFLPLLSTLLILDYFSVTSLGILPSEKLFIILLILMAIAVNFKSSIENFYHNRNLLMVSAIFIIYIFIVTFLHGIVESEFIQLVIIFTLLLGFISQTKTSKLFFGSFILAAFLLAFQGYFLKDKLIDESYGTMGKLSWTDPNYMSLIIDFGILLSLYLVSITKNIIARASILFIILFQFYIILLLGSRGGLIICILTALFLFRRDFLSRKIIYYSISAVALIIIFYQMGLFETIQARFQENNLSTAGSRTIIWDRILMQLSQRDLVDLFFGTGSTTSWYSNSMVYALRSPHNNYLEFLFDYGIVGLSLFLGLLVFLFFKSENNLTKTIIIFIALSAIALSPFNYEYSWLYLLLAIYTYKQKEIFSNEQTTE